MPAASDRKPTDRRRVQPSGRNQPLIGQRIDSSIDSLLGRIDATNKRIDSRFTWLIMTMVTLMGIRIAVMKL